MNTNDILYQIHGMAALLEDHFFALKEKELLKRDPDDAVCEPIMTIATIIKEKAVAALEKTEELEIYFDGSQQKEDAQIDVAVIQ